MRRTTFWVLVVALFVACGGGGGTDSQQDDASVAEVADVTGVDSVDATAPLPEIAADLTVPEVAPDVAVVEEVDIAADIPLDAPDVCVSDCGDSECGDDGCGGSCGECPEGEWCTEGDEGVSACIDLGDVCVAACLEAEAECGLLVKQIPGRDSPCDCGDCGDYQECKSNKCSCKFEGCEDECCPQGLICFAGACCAADCVNNQCGDDGCGGSCGDCDGNAECIQADGGDWICFDLDAQCLKACVEEGADCGTINYPWLEWEGECECGECGQLAQCAANLCVCDFVDCDGDCCPETEICFEDACCQPSCEGLECGPDACGVDCGTCGETQVCENNACVCDFEQCGELCCTEGQVCFEEQCCQPDCTGLECGLEACGVDCGACGQHELCQNNSCMCEFEGCGEVCCGEGQVCFEEQCCQSDCSGLECGPDTCGVDCGTCGDNQSCENNVCTCQFGSCGEACCGDGQTCFEGQCCQPDCSGLECGLDVCGVTCGNCGANELCQDNACVCEFEGCGEACCGAGEICFEGACCQPDCSGLECGLDACGVDCGACGQHELCQNNSCVCEFEGCGEVCCQQGQVCAAGACCTPDCNGVECGADGCGGSCGECDLLEDCNGGLCECTFLDCAGACCEPGELCFEGQCCLSDCSGLECGLDLCGVDCGACGLHELCEDNTCECEFEACEEACCQEGQVCADGQCCTPDCTGVECDDDGCGGSCGTCGQHEICDTGACVCEFTECLDDCCADAQVCHDDACCTPDCAPGGQLKECGNDGCGESCGVCGELELCVDEQCVCTMLNLVLDAGKSDSLNKFLPDGNGYIVTGNSYSGYVDRNYWIARVDGTGAVVDQNITAGYGSVKDMVELDDGGWVMAGTGKNYNGDYWLAEFDENLDLVWEKSYGVVYPDRCNGMVRLPDGGYVLAGETEAKLGSKASMWIIKTDSAGVVEWEDVINWGLDRRHAFKDVIMLPDNHLLAVGRSQETGYWYRDRLVKYDFEGNVIFNVLGNKGEPQSVMVTSDGYFVMVGHSSAGRYIRKFDSEAQQVWSHSVVEAGLLHILEMPDGSYLGLGNSSTQPSDMVLYSVTPDGELLWRRQIGGANPDSAGSLLLQDDTLVISGWTESFGAAEKDGWFLQTDLKGNLGCDCGNGVCDAQIFEDCNSCSTDCGCGQSEVCTPFGQCCTPDCEGKTCGDDGCSGSCGDCPEGEVCADGVCS